MKVRQDYEVPVLFTFEGSFFIKAKSLEDALAIVQNHCGMDRHAQIQSMLPTDVVNWEFRVHPQKEILLSNVKVIE